MSCCGSVPAQRSVASLWRRGGRDDERNDLRDDGTIVPCGGGPLERRLRGLALRMDHGSQYLSDHFLNQVRYWGIHPSFGFVEEPETNGVVERWNRTLKEQAIYGRVFHNLAEVRAAVAAFVERYNQCWRLETTRTSGCGT